MKAHNSIVVIAAVCLLGVLVWNVQSVYVDQAAVPAATHDLRSEVMSADTDPGPSTEVPYVFSMPDGVTTEAAPVPPAYKPPKGEEFDCDLPPVLFVNNYVEGLGNWRLGWLNMLVVAKYLGRAVVEPCLFSMGGVACSYGRLIDDADPATGYQRAFKEQKSGAVPKHVFPFSYYFADRSAELIGVTVIPYKRFISCAVAAQQAAEAGKAPPQRAGPPTTRLKIKTWFKHRFDCGLYTYQAPGNQTEFAVSEDVVAQRCVLLQEVAEAAGKAPEDVLLGMDDPVVGLIDVWNRHVNWEMAVPSRGQACIPNDAHRVYVAAFHMEAMKRFAEFMIHHHGVPLPDGESNPMHALTVFHWRSETVRLLFDDHMEKCGKVLGGTAAKFLDDFYGKGKGAGVIMSDLPTSGTTEKWLSYIGKDGQEERLRALPALIGATKGRVVDYSQHALDGLHQGKDSVTIEAIAVDMGVITIRELALALWANSFVSCEDEGCKLCCRSKSAFTRLIHFQRRRGLGKHAKTLSYTDHMLPKQELRDMMKKDVKNVKV